MLLSLAKVIIATSSSFGNFEFALEVLCSTRDHLHGFLSSPTGESPIGFFLLAVSPLYVLNKYLATLHRVYLNSLLNHQSLAAATGNLFTAELGDLSRRIVGEKDRPDWTGYRQFHSRPDCLRDGRGTSAPPWFLVKLFYLI